MIDSKCGLMLLKKKASNGPFSWLIMLQAIHTGMKTKHIQIREEYLHAYIMAQ